MAISSKGRKPDNFESRNSLKLRFTIIRGLRSILLNVNLLLNQILLIFPFCVRQTWMTRLILAILCEGLSSFNPKGFCYAYAWSCSLCERRPSFCTGLISSLKICGFLLMFSTGFTLFSVLFFFLYRSLFRLFFPAAGWILILWKFPKFV